MDKITSGVVTVFTAIIGVAIIAALVSKNANTSGVTTAIAQGFAGSLTSALAPIDGGGFSWGMSGGAPIENYS